MVKEFKKRFGIKIKVNAKPEVPKQGYKQDETSLDDLLSLKDMPHGLRLQAFWERTRTDRPDNQA